jgi:hypothetical protein
MSTPSPPSKVKYIGSVRSMFAGTWQFGRAIRRRMYSTLNAASPKATTTRSALLPVPSHASHSHSQSGQSWATPRPIAFHAVSTFTMWQSIRGERAKLGRKLGWNHLFGCCLSIGTPCDAGNADQNMTIGGERPFPAPKRGMKIWAHFVFTAKYCQIKRHLC